jgi:hypothetical protein
MFTLGYFLFHNIEFSNQLIRLPNLMLLQFSRQILRVYERILVVDD